MFGAAAANAVTVHQMRGTQDLRLTHILHALRSSPG
jgi:hypothetical protein